MKIKIFAILLVVLFALNCDHTGYQPSTEKKDSRFHTTAPSRLYFNNIRSTSYEKDVIKNSRMDTYQLRQFSKANNHPILYPKIVQNWLEDEAYIFLAFNDYTGGYSDTLTIKIGDEKNENLLFFNQPTPIAQYEWAEQIHDALKKNMPLFVRDSSRHFVPILKTGNDASSFLVTMKDYYKLTERR